MNWLDAVIAIILVVTTYLGWKNGMVRAVVLLGGVALGLFLAGQYYDELSKQLESFITNPNGAKVVAFLGIFLAIMFGAIMAGKVVRQILRLILLGWVDSLGGAALGGFIGATLCTGLAIGLQTFPIFELDQSVQESLLGDFLVRNFPAVMGLLPKEFNVADKLPR